MLSSQRLTGDTAGANAQELSKDGDGEGTDEVLVPVSAFAASILLVPRSSLVRSSWLFREVGNLLFDDICLSAAVKLAKGGYHTASPVL